MPADNVATTGAVDPRESARSPRQTNCLGLLIELLNSPGTSHDHRQQLEAAVAAVLDAAACSIEVFATDGAAAAATQGAEAGANMLVVPIGFGSSVIGVLRVTREVGERSFSEPDRSLAELIASFIARSQQITHLRNLLNSRFARVALVHADADSSFDTVLRPAMYPEQMVRLLARSFYKEMRRAGFGSAQIVNAASEIIAQLTHGLKPTGTPEEQRSAPDTPPQPAPAIDQASRARSDR